MKPANDWLKKPLSEKHQTNANAVVPPVTTVSHSSTNPTSVASDENVCSLSMVSVGPYEDFAVSIMLYICYIFSVQFFYHVTLYVSAVYAVVECPSFCLITSCCCTKVPKHWIMEAMLLPKILAKFHWGHP